MAPLPPEGTFRLYPYANPPLPAGPYTLTGDVSGMPGQVESLQTAIDVTAPRYALPPDQVLSTFPPASARGAFTSRLPQIVLRRRTLPWERSRFAADGRDLDTLDEVTRAATTPRPWLALVLVAESEGNLVTDVPVGQCVTPGVALGDDTDVVKGTSLEVPLSVVAKIFPALEDLPLLCHVREVDLRDTELAMGDDDGWMAVVLCNRLPQPGTTYTACLVNLEGQYQRLPVNPPVAEEYKSVASVVDVEAVSAVLARSGLSEDAARMGLLMVDGISAGPPAGAGPGEESLLLHDTPTVRKSPPSTGASWGAGAAVSGIAALNDTFAHAEPAASALYGTAVTGFIPWHLIEPTLRFPVLVSWSFTCTDAGDFQFLAENVNSRLLGHVATEPESPDGEPLPAGAVAPGLPTEPLATRPLPLVTATGHVATAHRTRAGEGRTAWFRGPLVPDPVARATARPDGRYPLAHHADQLRRVVADGQEDLTYAAAFEIGRLLALSRPSVIAALNRWRGQRFGAATTAALASRIAMATPAFLRELLQEPDPYLDQHLTVAVEGLPGPAQVLGIRGGGAGRRFARGILAALGDSPKDVAATLSLADPGFAVDDPVVFAKSRDTRLLRGLGIDRVTRAAVRDPAAAADGLWAAPVAAAERDPAADLAAARVDLENLAARLTAATTALERGLADPHGGGGPG